MILINKAYIVSIKVESHSKRYYIRVFTTFETFNRYYKTKKECELILRNIEMQLSTGCQFICIK